MQIELNAKYEINLRMSYIPTKDERELLDAAFESPEAEELMYKMSVAAKDALDEIIQHRDDAGYMNRIIEGECFQIIPRVFINTTYQQWTKNVKRLRKCGYITRDREKEVINKNIHIQNPNIVTVDIDTTLM